eukprot:517775-Rhodomonas_salina.3
MSGTDLAYGANRRSGRTAPAMARYQPTPKGPTHLLRHVRYRCRRGSYVLYDTLGSYAVATRCPVLRSAILLPGLGAELPHPPPSEPMPGIRRYPPTHVLYCGRCYAMSSTDIGYAPTSCRAPDVAPPASGTPISLRARYAVSGTDLA